MTKDKKLRVAAYCRTSGEGQRDNTSIPDQRDAIRDFCKACDWEITKFYVDECKSGADVAGRDAYQHMMRDGALGKFDAVVPYDMTRFGRDGLDILNGADFLKANFKIFTVDTRGKFDNRRSDNTIYNFLQAGMAEDERLRIRRRTVKGRIAHAKTAQPGWTSHKILGREWDKEEGKWVVNDEGRMIRRLLERFARGETLKALCEEYGIPHKTRISKWVHEGRLSGLYVARLKAPEIEDPDVEVPVPEMPEVVPASLLERVKVKLLRNRTFNRTDAVSNYLLSGYIRCGHCGCALTGQKQVRYRHRKGECPVVSIRRDVVEAAVLDYLYGAFADEPEFARALARAMPTDESREELDREIARSERRLARVNKDLERLADSVLKGVSAKVIVQKQGPLLTEAETLEGQLIDLRAERATMPDPVTIQREAQRLRQGLRSRTRKRDWRKLDADAIQQFLAFLFGDSKKHGVFVELVKKRRWVVTVKGLIGTDEVLSISVGKPSPFVSS